LPRSRLGRLAAWCYDHRRRVLLGWLLVVAVIGLAQRAGSGLVGATVVRMVLVPAIMQLPGSANWWLPGRIGRAIPNLAIEPQPRHRAEPGSDCARWPEPLALDLPEAGMRKSTASAVSLAWGLALGGTFGCLLPYLLGEWHFHQPLPYWAVARAAGGLLICAGLVPLVQAFTEFIRADGTPVPAASPPRLVVSGFYRYVRNPIYVGFIAIMSGEALLFGSLGLLEYTAVACCIGAAAVRFYEEPTLARRFGAEYRDYRRAVRGWVPRLRPWTPGEPAGPAGHGGSTPSPS